MNPDPVHIRRLGTGVAGLDAVLGGGLPELSFNLIAGGPGTGKTTLAHQLAFANATAERPAIVFTVLGEPTIKLLRHQQQYTFFDPDAINTRIRWVNLAQEAVAEELERVLARIVQEVEDAEPGMVVVDSFRTVASCGGGKDRAFEHFVQTLAVHLTTWNVTALLLGEYRANEVHDPVFTVADGILFLEQAIDRNSVARKLQVVKMRGQDHLPGLHTYRITGGGLQVFPRTLGAPAPAPRGGRLSTGIPGLDAMLGGGIPTGDAVVVAGPPGSGKTTLTTQFVAAGAAAGETSVLVVFEEFPESYVERARRLVDLRGLADAGRLAIIYLRPLDLSVDETLHEIREAVTRIGASRVVIDSLSGFEIALAPTYRQDFSESLYRLVGSVIGQGVTVMMTTQAVQRLGSVRFHNDAVSFLTDDIIVQSYVEMAGQLRTVIGVLKMRGSHHANDLRLYECTQTGLVIGEVLAGWNGVSTGVPTELSRESS